MYEGKEHFYIYSHKLHSYGITNNKLPVNCSTRRIDIIVTVLFVIVHEGDHFEDFSRYISFQNKVSSFTTGTDY